MATIDSLCNKVEELGWKCNVDASTKRISFEKYCGDYDNDYCFEISYNDEDGFDAQEVIDKIEEYADDFDVDYEAYLWLGEDGHGKNGAPYRMKDCLRSMEQTLEEHEELVNNLNEWLETENKDNEED